MFSVSKRLYDNGPSPQLESVQVQSASIDDDDLAVQSGEVTEPERIRSNFPETWLWEIFEIRLVMNERALFSEVAVV